ncbi:MAG: non-ribosomal peptide synthetase [Verrucomicrobiales bacterium]|nr:non-ribosomal peptide synthetase [Verrucomicrobiales bacterium]
MSDPRIQSNATRVDWPRHACVHQLFEEQVARTPQAVAVEFEGKTLTYSELNRRANQLAHALRRKGVQANSLVGVSLERSIEVLVGIYAILKAGGAYVPLDPTYPAERLDAMISGSRLRLLLTSPALAGRFSSRPDLELMTLNESDAAFASECSDNPTPGSTPDDLIYVIFTSGSTGAPKGAAVYHRGFTNLIHWFVSEFNFDSRDHVLLVSSLSFDLTQKNLYAPLIRGGTLHLYPPGPYDISLLGRLIARHGITYINCTPSAFYPLIEPFTEETANRLSSLRVVCLGGEPISIPRLRTWITHPKSRAEVANTYGPTECTDICGFYRLTRDNLDRYDFVPLGRPIYNAQIAILDPELRPCPIGTPGELCIGGTGIGAGYVNDTTLTQQRFIANPLPEIEGSLIYRSGDQARWLPDGVIEFLGRLDHQVKVRGYRVELREIENALQLHPSVREPVVVACRRQENEGAQSLAAYVTLKDGASADSASLKQFLRDRLPDYMVPSTLSVLDSFPLSPNGKVDRRALAERAAPDASPSAPVPNGGNLEGQIAALWREILSRSDVRHDISFFDVDGDSIRLAQLHTRLQALVGREFPLTQLFAATTVRTQAEFLGLPHAAAAGNATLQDRARRQREALAAANKRGRR